MQFEHNSLSNEEQVDLAIAAGRSVVNLAEPRCERTWRPLAAGGVRIPRSFVFDCPFCQHPVVLIQGICADRPTLNDASPELPAGTWQTYDFLLHSCSEEY